MVERPLRSRVPVVLWIVFLVALAIPGQAQSTAVSVSSDYVVEGSTVTISYSGFSGQTLTVTSPQGHTFTHTPSGSSGSAVFPTQFQGTQQPSTDFAGTYSVQSGAAAFRVGHLVGAEEAAKGSEVTARASGYVAGSTVTVRLRDSGGGELNGLAHPIASGVALTADAQGRVQHTFRMPHAVANGGYMLEFVAGASNPSKASPDRSIVTLTPAQVVPVAAKALPAAVQRLQEIDVQVRIDYGDALAAGDEFTGGLALLLSSGGEDQELAAAGQTGGIFSVGARAAKDLPLGTAALHVPAQTDRFGNEVVPTVLGQVALQPAAVKAVVSSDAEPVQRQVAKLFSITFEYPDTSALGSDDISPQVALVHTGAGTSRPCTAANDCILQRQGGGWSVSFTPGRAMELGTYKVRVPQQNDVHGNVVAQKESLPFAVTAAALDLGFQHTSSTGVVTPAYFQGDRIELRGTIEYHDGTEGEATFFDGAGAVEMFITRSDGTVKSVPVTPSGGVWSGSYAVSDLDPPGPAVITFFARDDWGNFGRVDAPTVIGLLVEVDAVASSADDEVPRAAAADVRAVVRGQDGTPATLESEPTAQVERLVGEAWQPVGSPVTMASAGGAEYQAAVATGIDWPAGSHRIVVTAKHTNGEPGLGRGGFAVLPTEHRVTAFTIEPVKALRGEVVSATFKIQPAAAIDPALLGPTVKVVRVSHDPESETTTMTDVQALEATRAGEVWQVQWQVPNTQTLGGYALLVAGSDSHGNGIEDASVAFEVAPGRVEITGFGTDKPSYTRGDTALLRLQAINPDGSLLIGEGMHIQLLRPDGRSQEIPLAWNETTQRYEARHTFTRSDLLAGNSGDATLGYRFMLPAGAFRTAAGDVGPANDLVTPHLALEPTFIVIDEAGAVEGHGIAFTARYVDGTPVPSDMGPPDVQWVHVQAGERKLSVDQVRHDGATGTWVATWDPVEGIESARFVVEGVDRAGNVVQRYESESIELDSLLSTDGKDSPLPLLVALGGLACAFWLRRR